MQTLRDTQSKKTDGQMKGRTKRKDKTEGQNGRTDTVLDTVLDRWTNTQTEKLLRNWQTKIYKACTCTPICFSISMRSWWQDVAPNKHLTVSPICSWNVLRWSWSSLELQATIASSSTWKTQSFRTMAKNWLAQEITVKVRDQKWIWKW